MTEFIHNIHFLRPLWLLALVPFAGIFLYRRWLLRKGDVLSSTFAAHLLPHLLINNEKPPAIRPDHIVPLFWLLTIFALAGPSWQQEQSPFAEDQAPLVIVLKVTPTMEARDIQPSRLQRSVQKISDLLEMRRGARTALVAYAGSSHLVMPLTRDDTIITTFARELSPKIMPLEGDNPADALALSSQLLEQDGAAEAGSVLLVTDSISSEHHPALQSLRNEGFDQPVNILAMAAPPGSPLPANSPPAPALDLQTLKNAARILGGTVTEATVDSEDIIRMNRAIVSQHETRVSDEGQRWKDNGWSLLFPLTLLALCWSRKGWYLRWEE